MSNHCRDCRGNHLVEEAGTNEAGSKVEEDLWLQLEEGCLKIASNAAHVRCNYASKISETKINDR